MPLGLDTCDHTVTVTIIEAVYVNGTVIPPFVIVPGKKNMCNWYNNMGLEDKDKDVCIVSNENGYTDNDIALKWLEHFIKHTKSSPTSRTRVLLMDGHKSHITPAFTLLATQNNIHTIPFQDILRISCNCLTLASSILTSTGTEL